MLAHVKKQHNHYFSSQSYNVLEQDYYCFVSIFLNYYVPFLLKLAGDRTKQHVKCLGMEHYN